jgi:NAD(P)-dependent dehydrogenase (short-subunit alcohol dehydrogenase family)
VFLSCSLSIASGYSVIIFHFIDWQMASHIQQSSNIVDERQVSQKNIVVITGATSGIGRAVALSLGRCGVSLGLVGRNAKKGEELVRLILSDSSDSAAQFFQADISNMAEVRDLVSRLKNCYDRIDVLINNAGARFSQFEETSEGIERTFSTNHLGHFLLTACLLEHLIRAPAARILIIGSGAHFGIRNPTWGFTRTTYERKLAYGTSKLANIIFAYELARRLSSTSVTSNAVDPGGVATNLGRNNGVVAWLRHLAYYAWRGQLIRSRQAAEHVAYMALAKELTGVTGLYFHERKPVMSSTTSQDLATARELWSLSVKLTGIDASLGQAWEYMRPTDNL